eukprot:1819136-Pleurochrysis_carterae.AAC.1
MVLAFGDPVTFAQCALGAQARKYTTVAYAAGSKGREGGSRTLSAHTEATDTRRWHMDETWRGGHWRRGRQCNLGG